MGRHPWSSAACAVNAYAEFLTVLDPYICSGAAGELPYSFSGRKVYNHAGDAHVGGFRWGGFIRFAKARPELCFLLRPHTYIREERVSTLDTAALYLCQD